MLPLAGDVTDDVNVIPVVAATNRASSDKISPNIRPLATP